MFVGGGTRLPRCKKSYCLSVPIVVPTLLKGWGTISLGGNRGKVAFSFNGGSGWDRSLGKKKGGGEGIITASNIISNGISSYHPY